MVIDGMSMGWCGVSMGDYRGGIAMRQNGGGDSMGDNGGSEI